ncbi:DUF2334 domain-containing protein [Pueribacillus theae]|nr:DUF2334 domain-containing protein [Pueribacillus theae]
MVIGINYRENETGEGFEYWDVKYDRPVYQENEEPVFFREDFESDEEFQEYVKKGLQFERDYIQSTVEQGVDELLEQKLYPLAFEAPHYTMSSTGYKELANYFSTYVGQIQISDETYQATFPPLFESTPSYLGGMTLLPETLGYVDGSNLDSYKNIVKKAEEVSSFSDSYLSFFYHPYLGIELLKETIEEMKAYDEYEWVDLKEMSNKVEVQDVVITSEDGRISVERSLVENIVHKLGTMWWFIIPVIVFLIAIVSMKKKR